MIRILHSVSYLTRGGIETMLMNYYRHIDRSKVQFDFLCNSYRKGAYDDEVLALGGKIFRSPGFNPLKYCQYKCFMKKLFEEHPEYRVVEAHNDQLGRFALKLAKDCGVPVRIFHAHSSMLLFDYKWPIKYYCMKTLKYSVTHHFICGLKAGEFYFGKDTIHSGNFNLIRNAIEVERFTYNESVRNEMRKKYGLNDKKVIGLVANFVLAKNHPFLIDVFEKIKLINTDAFLVLVGGGPYMDKIKDLVKRKGLSESILFTGPVSNTNEWYQAFDLFLMPSLHEGLPVVGVEAQAADLPCIFSSEVTQEIKLSDKSQFLDLKISAEEWAKRVNEVLMHLPERNNNYQLITDNGYNIKIEAQKLQDLYISLYKNPIAIHS